MRLILPAPDVILAVAETEQPSGPSSAGLGAIVLTLAVAALLVWAAYLWISSRARRRAEETPQNLQPYLSDDELESGRLTRVLTIAVISAAILAIVLPVYYVNESNRQANAAEYLGEINAEEGEKWFEEFSCINCHGPGGVGGGAPFTERRSTMEVSWTAPSLNDIFFRFPGEQVRNIIVNGRDGTPMPANGLEGGGQMTVQEIDQVIAYLGSIQVSQGEAFAEVEPAVRNALERIANGEEVVTRLLAEQQAELNDIGAVPEILEEHSTFLAESGDYDEELARVGTEDEDGEIIPSLHLDTAVESLISRPGDCTEESAALVSSPCESPGADGDRDGITDSAEPMISAIAALAHETLVTTQVGDDLQESEVGNPAFDVVFDPANGFTNSDAAGNAIADFDELETFLEALGGEILQLIVVDERIEAFQEITNSRIAFLEESLEARLWEVDFDAVADAMERPREEAERAVGLFNAYCARCHTGGYSAGVAYEQEAGAGAWGPSLRDGRAVVQFPSGSGDPDPGFEDHVTFVIRGSENGVTYGINGLGTGRMPGFGQILSRDDIELIVRYERTL